MPMVVGWGGFLSEIFFGKKYTSSFSCDIFIRAKETAIYFFSIYIDTVRIRGSFLFLSLSFLVVLYTPKPPLPFSGETHESSFAGTTAHRAHC